jgi:hypothetical protein
MSLLTSQNEGTPGQKYFIENIGGSGAAGANVPCIKGTTLGAVRIGDPAVGLVVRGDATGAGYIRGGAASSVAGSFLTLGASTAQPSQIVMSDAIVTINAPLSVAGAGNDFTVADDINVGGNIVLTNGDSTGKSISGYYNEATASASYADNNDTPIANPAGLTAGWYILSAATATGSQQEEQISTIVHRSAGGLWDIGGSIRSAAGTGTFGFKPSADRTTMVVQNSSGAAQTATIYWAKLLN